MPKENGKKGVVKKFVKNLDVYAKPITMTYQGSDKFKSTFGGAISMILLILIIALFFYKITEMV